MEGKGAHGSLMIAEAKLWEPLQAYLYRLKIELLQSGEAINEMSNPSESEPWR